MADGERVRRLPNSFDDCPACGDSRVEAAKIMAASHERIATSISIAMQDARPFLEETTKVLQGLNSSGRFMRKWMLPFLLTVPWILSFVGAITPEMAKGLNHIFASVGTQ